MEALRVTDSELERLPALGPFVTRREGVFSLLDIPGPCPYLKDDGRCGTFATRPFDCSLYPVNVVSVGVRRPDGSVRAVWQMGGGDCPERTAFVRRAHGAGISPLRAWLVAVTGANRVRLVRAGGLVTAARDLLKDLLDRCGLEDGARLVTGRAPRPRKPAARDR